MSVHAPAVAPKVHLGQILATSIPMMLSQLIMTLGGLISVLILSYLGGQVFAASMLISSIQLVLTVVPFSLFFCLAPVIGQVVGGKKDLQRVGRFTRASLFVSLLIAVLLMVLLWNIKPILLSVGQSAPLADTTNQFFRYFLWCLPAVAILRVFYQVAMGLFRQKFVFGMSLFGLALSVFLGIGLVFGRFGMPAMGVEGLGLSFVIQTGICLLAFTVYFLSDKSLAVYRLFDFSSYEGLWGLQMKLVKMGGPNVIRECGVWVLWFIALMLMANVATAQLRLVPLGVQGGVMSGNLTAFLIGNARSGHYVLFDAGTLLRGIRIAQQQGALSAESTPVEFFEPTR